MVAYAKTNEGRVLLALRAGPVDREQMKERLGECAVAKAVPALKRKALIKSTLIDGFKTFMFRITPQGEKKCPRYREQVS